jgi:hypothetical protein
MSSLKQKYVRDWVFSWLKYNWSRITEAAPEELQRRGKNGHLFWKERWDSKWDQLNVCFCFQASAGSQRRFIRLATKPAPKPLSMFTTVTFEEQLLSIPSNAATPPKDAP